jgi:hypothetical protein
MTQDVATIFREALRELVAPAHWNANAYVSRGDAAREKIYRAVAERIHELSMGRHPELLRLLAGG